MICHAAKIIHAVAMRMVDAQIKMGASTALNAVRKCPKIPHPPSVKDATAETITPTSMTPMEITITQ